MAGLTATALDTEMEGAIALPDHKLCAEIRRGCAETKQDQSEDAGTGRKVSQGRWRRQDQAGLSSAACLDARLREPSLMRRTLD